MEVSDSMEVRGLPQPVPSSMRRFREDEYRPLLSLGITERPAVKSEPERKHARMRKIPRKKRPEGRSPPA
jgi:hypothetical protein